MSGSTLGPLRVYIVANDTQRLGKPIWKIDEEQGETWHKAEVPIPVDEIHNLDRFHVNIFLTFGRLFLKLKQTNYFVIISKRLH